jgi:hypothetical protein
MPSALPQGEPSIASLTLCFQKFISRNTARKGEEPTDLTLHHSAQKRKYLHNIFTIGTIGKGPQSQGRIADILGELQVLPLGFNCGRSSLRLCWMAFPLIQADRSCSIERSVASRATSCVYEARHRVSIPISVANRRALRTVALVVHSDADSSGWTVVARPELFPRFLRSSFCWLCNLAGAVATSPRKAGSFLVGTLHSRIWPLRTGAWPDGGRDFSFPFLVAHRAGWLDRPVPRLEFFPRHSFSLGFPGADDSGPGDHL